MSAHHGLILALIAEQASPAILADYGLSEESFPPGELRNAFLVLKEFHSRYGRLPKPTTIEEEVGGDFSFPDLPKEPIKYWADLVKQTSLEKLCVDGLKELKASLVEGNIEEFKNRLSTLARKTHADDRSASVVSLQEASRQVLARHDKREQGSNLSGVPFGLPSLDRESDGAQPGDTVAIVGRPSTGKTWELTRLSVVARLAGFSVLVATYEMSLVQMASRVLSYALRIPNYSLRRGKLGYHVKNRLTRVIEGEALVLSQEEKDEINAQVLRSPIPLKDWLNPNVHIDQDLRELAPPSKRLRKERARLVREARGFDFSSGFYITKGDLDSTVEDLCDIIEEVKPDAAMIDGAYLLRTRTKTTSRGDRVTYTAETLKGLAQLLNIPIYATYQFNRGAGSKGGLENIYMSDIIGQLASIVIGIYEGSDEDKGQITARHKMTYNILKGREFERGKLQVERDLDKMIIKEINSTYDIKETTDAERS